MQLENDLSLLGPAAASHLDQSHGVFIDGSLRSVAVSYALIDPSSGREFARAAEAGPAEVDAAVAAARAAFIGVWSRMRPHEREEAMLRLASLMEVHGKELAEIETLCSGRLLGNTFGVDVQYSAHVLRYMAGWATKIGGETKRISAPYLPQADLNGFTFREPVGVVAAIVPWNVALGIAIWKIAPALAAGATIVLKPAPSTPLSVLRLAELSIEAGIPPGVLNIVTGSNARVGQALIRHPDVALVTFTGSTGVGRQIAVEAAGALKRHSLELGGKSPVILFEDAPLDEVIPQAAWAIFANHGQNCCAGSRLYVQKRIYEAVIEGVAEIAAGITMGSPLDPVSQIGPLFSRAHRDRVLGYVADGQAAGARLAVGGAALGDAYISPTILAETSPNMRPVREEIFGPILVAAPFRDESEVLALANDSEFGLGASVWSNDLARVHRMTRGLEAGTVWVNCHNVLDVALPFGGWKASGIGADLSESAVLACTRVKATVHRYA
jgi:phenylacetaldehyde dehydrogenase